MTVYSCLRRSGVCQCSSYFHTRGRRPSFRKQHTNYCFSRVVQDEFAIYHLELHNFPSLQSWSATLLEASCLPDIRHVVLGTPSSVTCSAHYRVFSVMSCCAVFAQCPSQVSLLRQRAPLPKRLPHRPCPVIFSFSCMFGNMTPSTVSTGSGSSTLEQRQRLISESVNLLRLVRRALPVLVLLRCTRAGVFFETSIRQLPAASPARARRMGSRSRMFGFEPASLHARGVVLGIRT